MTGPHGGPGGERSQLTEEAEIESLLGTLEDSDCRAIIEATTSEALSASELSDRCDLPLSTTYRKLDQLTEVGVLDERVRLSRSGQHTSEYTLQIESIQLSVDPESGVVLQISDDQPLQSDGSLVAGAD
ncbi:helix-turn-helix domain-containing protein [Halovenus sp. WSH3]|uniref:Helix-turn-helix domain-containing protein n=1 Tax=Halovenus carboxidivorans TaxID=2692199 RepID=A0A6B0T4R7_9EURY|nr:helix-turn-helix domain-containing protein [Halovenus carboxidivorans]MXR51957.1 helix-turn-helix domain-containing protein [Halovenus carboxidivorans]